MRGSMEGLVRGLTEGLVRVSEGINGRVNEGIDELAVKDEAVRCLCARRVEEVEMVCCDVSRMVPP